MRTKGEGESDPRGWCAAIALAFLALALIRLGVPGKPYFDETHYVPAAQKLLGLIPANREHPLFAKEVIAASISLLGNHALAWRLPSALAGAFGLFAFGRLVWHVSHRRPATIFALLLLATNFLWFVQSRIAMLDVFTATLAIVGLWQFTATLHEEHKRARARFALAGTAMGLAMASKWSAVPLAIMTGLAFLALKLKRSELAAVRRTSLVEAFGWLGLLPLTTYWLTFAPAMFYTQQSVHPFGFVAEHAQMIALQDSVRQFHTYQSVWWQWLLNLRPTWYLYEVVDGAQRGVLLLGNPLTMLAGLPSLTWCLWAVAKHKRVDTLAMALCFVMSLGLWLVSGKPVQFYYHYLLPSVFLAGATALALDEAWRRGGWDRLASLAIIVGSVGLLAWFWPILSAAPLADRMAFEQWMWLDSWR